MAIYTSRGSATSKVAGTTLTISNVAANAGDFLCVVVGGQIAAAPTGVTWGGRDMNKAIQRLHTTPAFGSTIWTIRRVANTNSRTVTITWGSSINTKVAYAFTLDSPHVIDEDARALLTASTAPSVGPTSEHLRRDNFCAGILLAEGPTNDAVLTGITAGWTTGLRIGTAGLPQISNLTANEFYQQKTTCVGVTLAGTATTARDWIGLIAAFRIVEHSCIDFYGSVIEDGDLVNYKGTSYTVNEVHPRQNAVTLSTVGRVSAVECEALN